MRPARHSTRMFVVSLIFLAAPAAFADPAGLTAADFVAQPERERDLAAEEAHRRAREAQHRQEARDRIQAEGSAARTSSAAPIPPDELNPLLGTPRE